MTTEQINLRLDAETVAALERLADSEALDRAVVVRRLLEDGIERWQRSQALTRYQRGEVSIGRAAEEAGISIWEALDLARATGIAHPARLEDVDADVKALDPSAGHEERDGGATLADMPPAPGGVLLVGINPAHRSVAAGHYYQGALGRRLWKRLERLGLLVDPQPGAEDVTFARMGNGLTDVVKRPTKTAGEVSAKELEQGAAGLRAKIARWHPGLVLFAFKQAAASILPRMEIKPGPGPPIGDVPTFLLSGPYAPAVQAAEVDRRLAEVLAAGIWAPAEDDQVVLTQRITDRDIAAGRIRLPSSSKGLFPAARGSVQIVLRGQRFEAGYDPRLGGGATRERSGVVSLRPSDLAALVSAAERLRVSRARGGVIKLD